MSHFLFLDVVLPVHNEGSSIAATLREFYYVASQIPGVDVRFIVSEDGSTDDTRAVLAALSVEFPLQITPEAPRKGYSRAVVDGLFATERDFVLCVDSDGQCDPADLASFLRAMPNADLVVGWRNPRRDHWSRLLMSAMFRAVYRRLFAVPVRDPSCPFLLLHQRALRRLLVPSLGILQQGFWWEFVARASGEGLRIVELPVCHRPRTAGETQVYLPARIPSIAWGHLLGLLRLRREIRSRRCPNGR